MGWGAGGMRRWRPSSVVRSMEACFERNHSDTSANSSPDWGFPLLRETTSSCMGRSKRVDGGGIADHGTRARHPLFLSMSTRNEEEEGTVGLPPCCPYGLCSAGAIRPKPTGTSRRSTPLSRNVPARSRAVRDVGIDGRQQVHGVTVFRWRSQMIYIAGGPQ